MNQNLVVVDTEKGREKHNRAKYHCKGKTPETKNYIMMSQNPLDIDRGREEHN